MRYPGSTARSADGWPRCARAADRRVRDESDGVWPDLPKGNGTPRRAVASEVEPNLHHAPRRSVHRWKRPFLGGFEGNSLEITARTGSVRDGSEDRAVLGNDHSHPHFDVSADGSTGAPRNIGNLLMEP